MITRKVLLKLAAASVAAISGASSLAQGAIEIGATVPLSGPAGGFNRIYDSVFLTTETRQM